MGVRVFGIEMEENYGENVNVADANPDFHIEANSGNFSLGDDPFLSSGGSRMNQTARAGIMKPTGSNEIDVDLETIGHMFRAFLDQYEYTEGEDEYNTHEFWGGEENILPSWRGIATYDIMEKLLMGLICDGLKLEVSDEKMTASMDWIYKTEKQADIDPSTFEKRCIEGTIPVAFYDVGVKFDDKDPDGVFTSFSCEGKNNHNVDATVGLGSRHPQTRAKAQKRELSLSVVTYLTRETLRSIRAGEYGEVDVLEPSSCKVKAVPLELNIALCEDPDRTLKIRFPKSVISVEYEWSESDEIETTINLTPMGTGEAIKADGSTLKTDMYVRLVNTRPEIKVQDDDTPVDPTPVVTSTDISVSVTDGTDPVENVTVTLTDTTDNTNIITGTTGSAGGCTLSDVEYGEYTVEATATGYTTYTDTLTVTSSTSTLEITLTAESEP